MSETVFSAPFFSEKERAYAYWLSSIKPLHRNKIETLYEIFGSFEGIYHAPDEYLTTHLSKGLAAYIIRQRCDWDIPSRYEALQKSAVQMVLSNEPLYPTSLYHIPDAPLALFYEGSLPQENTISVAVIGSRDCSPYGYNVALELGEYLGKHGCNVISGMARGIDGISQRAAIGAGGYSLGVLGSGIDICYPPGNKDLYESLLEHGGIISEYVPGTPAKPEHFPPRNRLVSGLAHAIVVVEAREKSGTLITVDMALEQGKEIYAVPGRITDRLSDGCNRLLGMGAHTYTTPELLLSELTALLPACQKKAESKYNLSSDAATSGFRSDASKLPPLEKDLLAVYRQLDDSPKSLDDIAQRIGGEYPVLSVQMLLMQLCMEGLAVQVTQGSFCRGKFC